MRLVTGTFIAGLTAMLAFNSACGGDDCTQTLTCKPTNKNTGGAGGTASGSGGGGGGVGQGGDTGAGGSMLTNGAACGDANACTSGFCVDDVCCESACDATCMGCAIAGSEGQCSAVATDTDPDDECGLASCDGGGACLYGELRWSDLYAGTGSQSVTQVGLDADGNLLVAGHYQGGITVDGHPHVSAGLTDGFVAKLGPTGQRIWSVSFGHSTNSSDQTDQIVVDMAVNSAGDVVIVGTFTRNISGASEAGIDFNGGQELEIDTGLGGTFVAVLDGTTGAHVWSTAKLLLYKPGAVGVDPANNIFVLATGSGAITLDGFTHPSAGTSQRTLFAKLNPSGVRIASVMTTGNERRVVRPLPDGSSYVVGAVELVKYDLNLAEVWTRGYPTFDVGGAAVTVDGGVVIAGSGDGVMNFGGADLGVGGGDDVVVARIDANGDHVWSKRFGDGADQVARAIGVDAADQVTVCGVFAGSLDFEGNAHAAVGEDAFLLKTDINGAHLWSKKFGATGNQALDALAIAPDGSIGVAGAVSGSINFGGATHTATLAPDIAAAVFGP